MIDGGFDVEPAATFDADSRCAETQLSPRERETDDAELERKIEALANEKISTLWRLDVLRRHGNKGREAIVVRLHHAVADGLRMVKLAGDVLTFRDGRRATVAAVAKLGASSSSSHHHHRKPDAFFRYFLFGVAASWRWVADFFRAAVLDKMPDETAPLGHSRGETLPPTARAHATRMVATLAGLKALRDAASPGTSTSMKTTTLNDVILTALCGALDRLAPPCSSTATTRAFVAAAVPERHGREHDPLSDERLYNRFLMPTLELPRGAASRRTRLDRVRAATARLKQSKVAACVAVLSAALERLRLADALVFDTQRRLFGKHSFVYSNVPGFEEPVYFAGHKVADFAVYFPNMLTQTIFLTYDGKLSMSVSAARVDGKGITGNKSAEEDDVSEDGVSSCRGGPPSAANKEDVRNGDAAAASSSSLVASSSSSTTTLDAAVLLDAVAREFRGWEQEVLGEQGPAGKKV